MTKPPIMHDWEADEWDSPEALYEFEAEPLRPSRGIAKLLGFLFLLLVGASIVVGGVYGLWVLRQVNPPGKPGEKVKFTVTAADDLKSVANRLQATEIITSAKVFTWYVKQKGGLELNPGPYEIARRDNMGDVAKVLRTLPAQTFDKVTFPEGFTLDQISRRLTSKIPRLDSAKFFEVATNGKIRSPFQPPEIASLEGLVFPDTYQITGDQDESAILKQLLRQMELVGNREGLDKAKTQVGLTPYQVLIVASLIEKEAKFDEDRPKIASVIYNRLAINKELEIDATLYYGQSNETPFAQLRALDGPYNSYKRKGLPPTPIASPGAASIRAALNPSPPPPQSECGPGVDRCGYLYYVLKDKEGHHVFATTVEQHDANVKAAKAAGVLS
jgi:UPF0755 protein